jgi:hypothetical protein
MSVAESSGLMRALRRLMPEAMFSVSGERPWHNNAFAGAQLCILADIAGKHHQAIAANLRQLLPEHQFELGNFLVADIAVTSCVTDDNASHLVIDALLLDD